MMASKAQILANRANAALSTGPHTAAGKEISRYNARKHGLLSADVVLPNEDGDAFAALQHGIHEEFAPVGAIERELVDLVVAAFWRLRRARAIEAGILRREVYGQIEFEAYAQIERESRLKACRHISPPPRDALAELAEMVVGDRGAIWGDLLRLQEARAGLATADVALGDAFVRDAAENDGLSKLARHETSIQRTLFKYMEELRRIQDHRKRTNPSRPIGSGPILKTNQARLARSSAS